MGVSGCKELGRRWRIGERKVFQAIIGDEGTDGCTSERAIGADETNDEFTSEPTLLLNRR